MKITGTMLVVVFLLLTKIVLAQYREPSGRYYPGDEGIGLPPMGFTGKALVAAVILLALGWIIHKANEKPNGDGGSTFGGCLVFLGIFCAIPALAWLQTIVASIWVIGFIAVIIIGVIAILWDKMKGN